MLKDLSNEWPKMYGGRLQVVKRQLFTTATVVAGLSEYIYMQSLSKSQKLPHAVAATQKSRI